jgi:hypothetical protein
MQLDIHVNDNIVSYASYIGKTTFKSVARIMNKIIHLGTTFL